MSTPDNGISQTGGVKTLAIRLEPDLHAALSMIAQLRESTITDEVRAALQAHLALAKQTPELLAKANLALADIEREAEGRRQAIADLLSTGKTSGSKPRARSGS